MSALHDFRKDMQKRLASANGWLQDAARGFGSNAEHADYKAMESALEKVSACLRRVESAMKEMRAYKHNRNTDEVLREIVWAFAQIPGDDSSIWDMEVGGYSKQVCFRDWCGIFPHKREDLLKWTSEDLRSWWSGNRRWLNLGRRKKFLKSLEKEKGRT